MWIFRPILYKFFLGTVNLNPFHEPVPDVYRGYEFGRKILKAHGGTNGKYAGNTIDSCRQFECQPCPDGESFCLSIFAREIGAEAVDIDLVENPCVDLAECVGSEDCE